MEKYEKKIMAIIQVLKNRKRTLKSDKEYLENIISTGEATSLQKQEYFEVKGALSEVERVIDMAEGMIDSSEGG